MSDSGIQTGGRRGFRFRKKKHATASGQQQTLSFDDMESLGMESGSGVAKQSGRGRFRLLRGKQTPDSDSTKGHPHVITTHGHPDVITARPRIRSVDDLSFDGSFQDSASASANAANASKNTKKVRGIRRLMSKHRRSKDSEPVASEGGSDRSSLPTNTPATPSQLTPAAAAIKQADSFDSDDMLKYVKSVDSNVSYSRKNRSAAAGGGAAPLASTGRRRQRRGDFDSGGFASPVTAASGTSHDTMVTLPKRISFDGDTDFGYNQSSANLSDSMVTSTGNAAQLKADMESSTLTMGSTQTYRSMGTSDTGIERARYSVREGSRASKKKYRVRPYEAFSEPVHMTEEDIYNDSTKPSLYCEFLKSYIRPSTKIHRKMQVSESISEKYGTPARDGRIGSLRCEVLGCVSLARKKQPEICVYLIAGDAAFCTDVIQGYRSPMWPSASKRAAVFPVHHTFTRLYAGVFDVKSRKNKEKDAFCGRVCIDIASLRPNTEYDITFPLRGSTFVYDRHKRGVLRLRFSLHWFNERAAVLSYFKTPRAILDSSPMVGGCPTIPCADPKTFRNVAVTVHGSDFPGKYSKDSFRATVREFQLYQVNIRLMAYYLVIDAIFYEKPYISLYLFFAGMHCVLTESVTKVPPYFVGFMLIIFLENYKYYVADTTYNCGYQQLTLLEVFKALVSKTGTTDKFFEPILVTKRAKKRNGARRGGSRRFQGDSTDNPDDADGPVDHAEFPLADANEDPKLSVEDALAPSTQKNAKGGHTRLHGRLSVYYAPVETDNAGTGDSADEEDEEEDDDSDGDETVIGANFDDEGFDLDIDLEESGGRDNATKQQYGYADPSSGADKRILYNAQNVDDAGGAAVAPQVTVKRVENMFHRRSYSVAVEKVVMPPPKEDVQSDAQHQSELHLSTEQIEKQIEEKRKAYLDEFDKLLGLQSRSANPINRIMATFLGPLMRVLRIPIFIFRIGFNAYTWRDPYLSFWVFTFLCLALLVLMAFPWRFFFLVATIVGLGPQNIALRGYLEQRAKKRKEEEEKKRLQAEEEAFMNGSVQSSYDYGATPNTRKAHSYDSDNTSVRSNENKRGLFGRMKRKKDLTANDPLEYYGSERPAFSAETGGTNANKNANKKQLRPRSVVVPFSKLRKERFYDWPPDPTVSRATPVEMDAWQQELEEPEEVQMLSRSRRATVDGITDTFIGAENRSQDIRRRRGSH